MDSSLIANQLQKDRENAVSARPYSNDSGNRLQIYTGKIRTVNTGNYDVEVLGDDGYTVLDIEPAVLVVGSEAEYSVGDIVCLIYGAKKYPSILATGGGSGSTCSVSINSFGVKFG